MATRVLLDAGHGGWDNGATYNGRTEKADNLRLALAVGEILENNGVDVVYTRTEDVYQSPSEKARIGNMENVDYFISLHRNASVNNNQYSGIQTLLYNDGDIKEVLANNINRELEQVGFRNLGRDIRRDLAVLRQTNMPAVLVEAGFINTDGDNQIFDEEFDAVANAIAQGILETVANGAREKRQYRIQVGLFRNQDNARVLADELSSMGYTVEVEPFGGFYRVLVGRFDDFDRAERIEQVLRQDGYNTLIVM